VDGSEAPQPGQRVIVRTPDRREWRGVALGVREGPDGTALVEIRLDTGWVTTYPIRMVFPTEGRS